MRLQRDPGSLATVAALARASSRSLLGADLVEIAQVARSVSTFGERYLQRVYTRRELAYCTARGRDPAPHLAARFAAKEATVKVLRLGDEPLDWRWVEVARRGDGSCRLLLHRGMRALAMRRGVGALRVSMSHDGAYALAVVTGDAIVRGRRGSHRR